MRRSREAAIWSKTVSSVFDSSATEIISTIVGGKCPQAASGPANDSPAEMFSVASSIAAASIRLAVASPEIPSERRIGTPLCRSVPSTRQKRATARFRNIFPASGSRSFTRSRQARPWSVASHFHANVTPNAAAPNIHRIYSPVNRLMPSSHSVRMGSSPRSRNRSNRLSNMGTKNTSRTMTTPVPNTARTQG